MAKASDNVFPKIIEAMQTADPAAPADSSWKLYAKANGIFARSSNTVVGPFAASSAGSTFSSNVTVDSSGNHNVTTTTFAAMDTTNARVALTPSSASAKVLVTYTNVIGVNGGQTACFSFQVDAGGAVGGANGITEDTLSGPHIISYQWLFTGLAASSHNFDVMVRMAGGSSVDVGQTSNCRGVLTAVQVG